MKIHTLIILVISIFGLSSCIEILDDITLHNDGSGSLNYSINLSSNKVKINSILALDSLDGKKVPTVAEIETELQQFKNKLEAQPGIHNTVIEYNFTNFIFKFKCDFTSVNALQSGIKEVIKELNKEKKIPELEHNWLSFDGDKIVRSVPELTIQSAKKLKQEDIASLQQGTYTSITRFDRTVEKWDNPTATLNKNKTAVMVRTNPYALSQNPTILENNIYLSPIKN
jgi:hypothetical protein